MIHNSILTVTSDLKSGVASEGKKPVSQLLVICGPTATGKTTLAIKLAKKFNGEIISADSRQVYKDMDIGTGKDLPPNLPPNPPPGCTSLTPKDIPFVIPHSKFEIRNSKLNTGYYLLNGIKVWGLDIVNPDYHFNVGDYLIYSHVVLKNIHKQDKLPIVVGGTGLYIKAIVEGIKTAVIPPNQKFRQEAKDKTPTELFAILQKAAPQKASLLNNSDKNNPRRLIRAIEIAKSGKRLGHETKKGFNTLFIGLTAPKEILFKRIDQRVEKRLRQGIVNEIQGLLKRGYDWNLPSMSALGYREWRPSFEKKATYEEAVDRWKLDEHDYARRQLTWFKKDQRINWFDIGEENHVEKIEQKVRSWYNTA